MIELGPQTGIGLEIEFSNQNHNIRTESSERIGEPNHNCLSTRKLSHFATGFHSEFGNNESQTGLDEIDMIGLGPGPQTGNYAKSKWALKTDKKYRVECFSHEEHRPPMLLSIIDII